MFGVIIDGISYGIIVCCDLLYMLDFDVNDYDIVCFDIVYMLDF